MGQQEVISSLEKNKKWNTTEEIANELNVNVRIVRRALLVLFKYNEVLRKICKNSPHFKYVYKAI